MRNTQVRGWQINLCQSQDGTCQKINLFIGHLMEKSKCGTSNLLLWCRRERSICTMYHIRMTYFGDVKLRMKLCHSETWRSKSHHKREWGYQSSEHEGKSRLLPHISENLWLLHFRRKPKLNVKSNQERTIMYRDEMQITQQENLLLVKNKSIRLISFLYGKWRIHWAKISKWLNWIFCCVIWFGSGERKRTHNGRR